MEKLDFSPISCNSTLEMGTYKVMLLLSYLASLDNNLKSGASFIVNKLNVAHDFKSPFLDIEITSVLDLSILKSYKYSLDFLPINPKIQPFKISLYDAAKIFEIKYIVNFRFPKKKMIECALLIQQFFSLFDILE